MRRAVISLVLLLAACRHESDLPKLYPVPAAQLVAETGKPTNLDDLRGRAVVYSFIFTRCGATCPIMIRAYYNGMSQDEVAKLVEDVRDLSREDA